VFAFSAFFAGVSGGVFAHLLQYIHPDNFSFVKSLEYLIYLYVGGSESISGAIIGPAIFTLLPELMRGLKDWRMVIYPLILILTMIFRTEGIMGLKEFSFILIPPAQEEGGKYIMALLTISHLTQFFGGLRRCLRLQHRT